MSPVRTSSRALGPVLAIAAVLAACGLGAGAAPAAGPACPSFRILHDDRIGPAVLPAGNYAIAVSPTSGVGCSRASQLFTRFLEDYDGVLPSPWRVSAQGRGKASFAQGGKPGFSVALAAGGGGGRNSELGQLCRGTFTVNSRATVGPLSFPRGAYLLYIPTRSAIGCNRASILFTRFLGSPGGRLPFPWRLENQTATFFKPEHPLRSAFRVEPLSGAGPA